MNLAQYHPRNLPTKKKQAGPMIRSGRFCKKFEDGMPRINHKAIPFHFPYDLEIVNKQISQKQKLKFYAYTTPHKRHASLYQTINGACKTERHCRGEAILKKYMKRRPSLSFTARTYDFAYLQDKKSGQTHEIIEPVQVNEQKRNLSQKSKDFKQESFFITADEVMSMNKKSLYQMSPEELQISIQWKKKFLQLFKKRLNSQKK